MKNVSINYTISNQCSIVSDELIDLPCIIRMDSDIESIDVLFMLRHVSMLPSGFGHWNTTISFDINGIRYERNFKSTNEDAYTFYKGRSDEGSEDFDTNISRAFESFEEFIRETIEQSLEAE